MRQLIILLLVTILVYTSCKQKDDVVYDANQIINRAIEYSGGTAFENSIINFEFRNRHYKATRNKGLFKLERHFEDSLRSIKDILSNSGFKRFINNELVNLPDTMTTKYTNSVNSVHYFSVLPYGLNDNAVNKLYLGLKYIKGKAYHKIKVTFDEIGGGEDFEDVFIYWIGQDDFKVDYLAYSYHVNGGGMRFRAAYNERIIMGIRFVDYYNFYPMKKEASIEALDEMFENDDLKLLSKIELKNIRVELIN